MRKVFLGGTAAKSNWREQLIPLLTIDYFNPVTDEWNEKAREREMIERKNCDFLLYVFTARMQGFYAVAEVVDDSNKHPEKTIFCYLDEDQNFSAHQIKSLNAVGALVERNGGLWLKSLSDIAAHINQ